MLTPLVSIIIPCFNREVVIVDAIESALRQTYEHIEVLVIDDGSQDNSVNIIKKYTKHVTLLTQENKGVSAARNLGIKHCSGDYIIFLDSDDFISDDLVACHVAAAKKWPQAAIFCSDSLSIDDNGVQTELSVCEWPKIPECPLEFILLRPGPFPASEMYKAIAVKAQNGCDETLKANVDVDLRLRILLNGNQMVKTNGGFAVYRRVDNSITRQPFTIHKYAMILINKLSNQFQSDSMTVSLLNERKLRIRVRLWNAFFCHHTSLYPLSMVKFCYYLIKVTTVDSGYFKFILFSKPWKLTHKPF